MWGGGVWSFLTCLLSPFLFFAQNESIVRSIETLRSDIHEVIAAGLDDESQIDVSKYRPGNLHDRDDAALLVRDNLNHQLSAQAVTLVRAFRRIWPNDLFGGQYDVDDLHAPLALGIVDIIGERSSKGIYVVVPRDHVVADTCRRFMEQTVHLLNFLQQQKRALAF